MQLTQSCYGNNHLKPPWLFDIADQFEIWYNMLVEAGLDQIVPDTFPLERNHIGVKHLAQRIFNMATFEDSLLSSVITSQRVQLIDEPVGDRLSGTPAAMPSVDGMMMSDRAVVGGLAVAVRDYIFLQDQCGRVRALVKDDDGIHAIVTALLPAGQLLLHCKRFHCAGTSS